MNYDRAKELAMKMVNDRAEVIAGVVNTPCDEDGDHEGKPCCIINMEEYVEGYRGTGKYRCEFIKGYSCCIVEAIERAGETVEGSTDFINKPGIPVFVFIDRYVVAYRVTDRKAN